MSHPLTHTPRLWRLKEWALDAIRFPRRKVTLQPAVWVEELMAQRFGALIVCQACARKYRDGLRRWGYLANAWMKAQGNACDFCQIRHPEPLPFWVKEEHPYPLPAGQTTALSPWPRNFRGDQLAPARHRPRTGSWLPPGVRPQIVAPLDVRR